MGWQAVHYQYRCALAVHAFVLLKAMQSAFANSYMFVLEKCVQMNEG